MVVAVVLHVAVTHVVLRVFNLDFWGLGLGLLDRVDIEGVDPIVLFLSEVGPRNQLFFAAARAVCILALAVLALLFNLPDDRLSERELHWLLVSRGSRDQALRPIVQVLVASAEGLVLGVAQTAQPHLVRTEVKEGRGTLRGV